MTADAVRDLVCERICKLEMCYYFNTFGTEAVGKEQKSQSGASESELSICPLLFCLPLLPVVFPTVGPFEILKRRFHAVHTCFSLIHFPSLNQPSISDAILQFLPCNFDRHMHSICSLLFFSFSTSNRILSFAFGFFFFPFQYLSIHAFGKSCAGYFVSSTGRRPYCWLMYQILYFGYSTENPVRFVRCYRINGLFCRRICMTVYFFRVLILGFLRAFCLFSENSL